MSILEFLLLLLVAGLAGGIAQALAGFSRGGCLVSIAVGFIGALLGSWLSSALGLPELFTITVGETAFPIIWSIIGATLFVAVLGMLTRRRA